MRGTGTVTETAGGRREDTKAPQKGFGLKATGFKTAKYIYIYIYINKHTEMNDKREIY